MRRTLSCVATWDEKRNSMWTLGRVAEGGGGGGGVWPERPVDVKRGTLEYVDVK